MSSPSMGTIVPFPSLQSLGLLDSRALANEAATRHDFLVEDLIFDRSVNLAVGDSGLGKSAVVCQLGGCVAAALPFFAHSVQRGPVIYLDGESPLREFEEVLETISRFLGLSRAPENFYAFNPDWVSIDPSISEDDRLRRQIDHVKPKLVIVDPLRVFWPQAEGKSEEATKVIKRLRGLSRGSGASWLIVHHCRKTDQSAAPTSLEESPHQWLQSAAGARALINQSDTRIGIDTSSKPTSDLVMSGFVRLLGTIPPVFIVRELNDDGDPFGYRALEGVQHLNEKYQAIYETLPQQFRFKTLKGHLSASSSRHFLDQCLALQLVRKLGKGEGYTKVGQVPGPTGPSR